MRRSNGKRRVDSLHSELESSLARALESEGLGAERVAAEPDSGADLVVVGEAGTWVIELKVATAARGEALQDRLAAAVLQARHYAAEVGARPLAVVGAPVMTPRQIERLRRFVGTFAPEMEWGVIDGRGLLHLQLRGRLLERRPTRTAPKARVRVSTFTDRHQWLLKIMLSPTLPPSFRIRDVEGLRVDAAPDTISELARRARVSVGTAHRLVHHLRRERFCPTSGPLVLVRRETLLTHWSALRPAHREIRAQLVLPTEDPMAELKRALGERAGTEAPAACLGLFAGAAAWGFDHVVGVPPIVYVRQLSADALEQLGLVAIDDSEAADVVLRQPAFPESVFRGARLREGVPVADLVQCWLDASAHAARGPELASLLYDALFAQDEVP